MLMFFLFLLVPFVSFQPFISVGVCALKKQNLGSGKLLPVVQVVSSLFQLRVVTFYNILLLKDLQRKGG